MARVMAKQLFVRSAAERRWSILFLWVLGAIWLFPVYSALRNSLRFNGLGNYAYVLSHRMNGISLYRAYLNSFIIALGHASLVSSIASAAAFAFSKIRFCGHRGIYYFILMCLAVPGTATLVPVFLTLKRTGLYNSYWAVILPEATLTLPFAVMMLRNYYDGIPDDMMESAMIDGAGPAGIFGRIYLPLAQPVLANLGVLCIMWSFQDFLNPLMFLSKKGLTTATAAVSTFKNLMGFTANDIGYYNASLVLLAVPSLIVLAAAQRYIRLGITSGALKG